VGEVERGSDKSLLRKRVVGEINTGCGTCSVCKGGVENHCPERTVLGILNKDGAFADFLALPQGNLHTIPDSISDEEAVFVEPLAAAFEITRQFDIGATDRVCVLGDGKLGLLVAQVINLTGGSLVTVGEGMPKS
jgi:threonine dehydrogenase-like Zn-dependent dehydrogenase